MAVDPNVYALSIQLQLDSSDAFSTLEEFSQAATDVEDRVSTAAQNSLNAITGLVDNLNEQLSQAVATTGEFAVAGGKLEANLALASAALRDASNIQSDNLQDVQERLDYLERIDQVQQRLEESLENEQKTGQLYLGLINQWIGALKDKNKVHDIEGQMVQEETDYVRALEDQWGKVKQKNIEINDVLQRIRATMTTLWSLIKMFDSETDAFIETNYRAYGSQQLLTDQTRQLSAELGVTRKSAIEAYKALADVKTPREEIDKLARVVSMAERTTGVGAQTIAEYTRSLRTMGLDAVASERHITRLTESMRKYGLSQNDVNKMMSQGGLDAYLMGEYFGGAQDEIEKFQDSQIHMAGFLKSLGLNTAASQDFHKWLTQNVGAMQQFEQLAGMNVNTVDDFTQAQVRAGIEIENRLGALREAAKTDKDAANALIAQRQALADAHFNGNMEAMAAVEAMGMEAKAMGLAGDSAEDYAKVVESLAAKQMDQWGEANRTLTKQLEILKNTIMGAVGPALQFLADGLMYVVMAINTIIKPIAYAITKFFELLNWIEANVPVIGWFVTALKVAAAILAFVAVGLLATGAAAATFATAFAGASTVVKGSLNVIRTIGRAIVSIANAIGQSIRVIFTGIGQGLAALGKAIQPVLVPLLVLGAVVMMVGAGFWMMGMGMAAAAEHGWAAVGMLAAMTVAMIVMVVTLAIVATIAGPVIPLMLGLAAVILILGAAAMLAGLGMYFIGLAVESLAMYGLQAAAALPALAGGIMMVALAGLFGFGGIMLLAVALWALAIPVMLLGMGMTMLATALNSLTAENIVPVAQALLEASAYFLGAALVMIIAGPLLAIGAAFLLAASLALMVASPFLIVASVLMVVAGGIMLVAGAGMIAGAILLLTAGIMMFPAGLLLLAGSLMLIASAPMLIIAGTLLIPAAVMLMVGGVLLNIAAAILLPAAIMTFVAGVLIGIGGIMMLRGMTSMMAAAALMMGAAWTLFWAAGALAAAVAFLVPVAPVMMAVGVLMMVGGLALLVGAYAIYYAAIITQLAATILSPAAQLMDTAMLAMLPAAQRTYHAGVWFITGATYMLIGAVMLMTAAMAIFSTSLFLLFTIPILMTASLGYFLASSIMLGASVMLFMASILTVTAGDMMIRGAQNLSNAAIMLMQADGLLMLASSRLIGTVGIFFISMAVLQSAAWMLLSASLWLLPASIGIYVAMSWLEIATRRFRRSVDDIEKMGKGMHDFAEAFVMLSKAPVDSIGDAADAALDAIPNVNKLANELEKSGSKFQAAADKFVKPVRDIAGSLQELGEAMGNIGQQGLNVEQDVEKLGGMLEKYTALLEGVSQRIEIAVAEKAKPAMQDARNEGLEDAVKADAITTVQVMDKTEGDAEKADALTMMVAEQTATLKSINEKLGGVAEGGETELGAILELLETYLPQMSGHKSGLTNEMNQWMK